MMNIFNLLNVIHVLRDIDIKENGKQWVSLEANMKKKSVKQIKTHAQNFFLKVESTVPKGTNILEYIRSKPSEFFSNPPFENFAIPVKPHLQVHSEPMMNCPNEFKECVLKNARKDASFITYNLLKAKPNNGVNPKQQQRRRNIKKRKNKIDKQKKIMHPNVTEVKDEALRSNMAQISQRLQKIGQQLQVGFSNARMLSLIDPQINYYLHSLQNKFYWLQNIVWNLSSLHSNPILPINPSGNNVTYQVPAFSAQFPY